MVAPSLEARTLDGPADRVILGWRADIRLRVRGDQATSTILRLLVAKHGEWMPYVRPEDLGVEGKKPQLFKTKAAAREHLQKAAFGRLDYRLIRVVRRLPVGWTLALRLPPGVEGGGEWRLASGWNGIHGIQSYPLIRGSRAALRELFAREVSRRHQPIGVYMRLRRRWTPVYEGPLPSLHLPLDLTAGPPGYHLARVHCHVTLAADNHLLADVVTMRRGGESNEELAARGKAEARRIAEEYRASAVSSALAATGVTQEPFPKGRLRTQWVWKKGSPPLTREAACAKRKRFTTYKAGFAAAAKTLAMGRGRMIVQPCGICGGFHLARNRGGKDGGAAAPDSGA